MKKALYSIAVLIVCGFLGYALFCFQPMMPAGTVVKLSSFQARGYDLQVWQRKNEHWTEPFATVVFVRHDTNSVWDTYTLDIQDVYKPAIQFQTDGTNIQISVAHKLMAHLDIHSGNVTYADSTPHASEGPAISPINWWTTPLPTAGVK